MGGVGPKRDKKKKEKERTPPVWEHQKLWTFKLNRQSQVVIYEESLSCIGDDFGGLYI